MEYYGLMSYNTDKYQEDHVSWWDCVDVISSSGYYPIDQWEQELDRIAGQLGDIVLHDCAVQAIDHHRAIQTEVLRPVQQGSLEATLGCGLCLGRIAQERVLEQIIVLDTGQ